VHTLDSQQKKLFSSSTVTNYWNSSSLTSHFIFYSPGDGEVNEEEFLRIMKKTNLF